MTNEELNTALYEKMFSEQETYRAWLLTQPPEEILNHTYEYTVREDILMSLEDRETSYMEEIWQTVTDRARTEAQKSRNTQMER